MYKKLHGDLMAPYRAVLLRAQERGELSGDLRIGDLLAFAIGPLFYRRWHSREPLNQKGVKGVLKLLLSCLANS